MNNAKSAAARAWAWYRALWSKGRWGIAAGIFVPLLILGAVQATLQSAGIVETPPTATPRPTVTDRPTRTPEPPTATDEPATETAAPPTDVPATAAPVPIQPAMQAPPPVQPAVSPPTEVPMASNDPNTKAKCADFGTRTAAQRWWAYWHAQGIANPGGLDGSDPPNGIVCEHLSP